MEKYGVRILEGGLDAFQTLIAADDFGIPVEKGLYLLKERDDLFISAEVYKGVCFEQFDTLEKALLWLIDSKAYDYIYEGGFEEEISNDNDKGLLSVTEGDCYANVEEEELK